MPAFDFLKYCRVCTDRCCTGDILVTGEERARIVERTGKDQFEPDGHGLFTIRARGQCPYLASDGLCSVHDIRPEVCRMYPYWPDVDDGQVKIPWDQTCPAAAHLPLEMRKDLEERARALVAKLGIESYARWYNTD
ncbi:MAG: YkgJ family cysteine cluster protein [Planctomycetes bacterium]|nr:YkgJ family cysteine cluster protein [Planctomycetota bacterium]MBI3844067.1 YkgJ family cysteine cluster protein [Planctomycetota bacterium]